MTRSRFSQPSASHVAILLIIVIVVIPAQAKRHDLVIMKNGDHLSGEVKRLENGLLYLDTDYVSDSIQLDWFQVEVPAYSRLS
jgi:hypothetical protein